MYQYKYPRAALTADLAVFGFDGRQLYILLIERGGEPYRGSWALPGGFLEMDETIEQCAARELREETGVEDIFLEQFHVYSDVNRDPRERVVTVAFVALVRKSDLSLVAGDDARRAGWFELEALPPLAFDHNKIIADARRHLQLLLRERPVGFRLLDEKFSIAELQRLYEQINEKTYDRRNFARKFSQSRVLRDEGVADYSSLPRPSRAPNLYSVDEDALSEAEKNKKGDLPFWL